MEEDVAGTRMAGAATSYSTCLECGTIFVRREARVAPTGLDDDGHSEFSELCPDCEKLDRQGERPLFTEPTVA